MQPKAGSPELRARTTARWRDRGALSIASRLTLLFVGATAVLLLLAAAFLHWGLEESLARQDRAMVAGKFHVLRLLLREQHDKPEVLASEVEHESSAHALLRYYLRVLDEHGAVVIETSGMSALLPARVFPAALPFASAAPRIVERTVAPGQTYLLLAGEALAAGHRRRTLQIALDVAHNHEILADYRWKLLAMLGAGVGFAAIAGAIVARRGLRPVHAIAQTAQGITASRLDERLQPAAWPSELRECAAAFDAMLDRLQDSFHRLSEFSADLAHALRNPINNLRGEMEVALTRARTAEEYRHTLASSLEEFERLSRLIDALLFLARADDPHAAIEPSRFPAGRELEAVRDFYEALAAEQQVAVGCEGEAELEGDPILVRRAISNLLGNALKHTRAGGRVVLAARSLPGGGVEISVADTGSGIAAEHLPRVFERFFQVEKTRDNTSKGAGLGLAIVRSVMRLHGGTAAIESEPGRGTTVRLMFPAARNVRG